MPQAQKPKAFELRCCVKPAKRNVWFTVLNAMVQQGVITTLMISSNNFWSEASLQASLGDSALQIKSLPFHRMIEE